MARTVDAEVALYDRLAAKMREDNLQAKIAKLIGEIEELQKKIVELKVRNASYLLLYKQEEQYRVGWQKRAMTAEDELMKTRLELA